MNANLNTKFGDPVDGRNNNIIGLQIYQHDMPLISRVRGVEHSVLIKEDCGIGILKNGRVLQVFGQTVVAFVSRWKMASLIIVLKELGILGRMAIDSLDRAW